MAYLLDANTLIQAKNEYHGFDFCPGFWAWLLWQNGAGEVYSIDRIQQELERGHDELAAWATTQGSGFFQPINDQTMAGMATVSNWVQSRNFSDNAKREFFSAPILF